VWNVGLLHEVLAHNRRSLADRQRALTKRPAKKMAALTCMDTRLVELPEPAMGIGRGDAKVIKNAGATLDDRAGDVVRSLAVAIFALGCEEVFVVGHRDCGMAQIDEGELRRRMLDRGVPPQALDELRPGLRAWVGAFADPAENVRRVVGELRRNPLIPAGVPVHGLLIDPASGGLNLLVDGYPAVQARAPGAR
jgi:carbonic anhydrase